MTTLPVTTKTNGFAKVSLIFGLIAPLYIFIFGVHNGPAASSGAYVVVLLGLIALVSGIVSLVQISKSAGLEKGKGLAIIGLILGLLSAGLVFLQIFVIAPYIQNVIMPQIMGTPAP